MTKTIAAYSLFWGILDPLQASTGSLRCTVVVVVVVELFKIRENVAYIYIIRRAFRPKPPSAFRYLKRWERCG